MFTDLGISVGHRLRGLPVDERRVRLSLIVISGFVAGGIATTLAYPRLGTHTLFIPSGLTAASAVTYWAYLYNKRRGTGESAPTPT